VQEGWRIVADIARGQRKLQASLDKLQGNVDELTNSLKRATNGHTKRKVDLQ
jgi:hypothetical protein